MFLQYWQIIFETANFNLTEKEKQASKLMWKL